MTIRPLLISCCMHLCLIGLGLNWLMTSTVSLPNRHQNDSLSSYLYRAPVLTSHEGLVKSEKKQRLVKKKQIAPFKKHAQSLSYQKPNPDSGQDSTEKTDHFIALLHAAIAGAQVYPISALEMRRQGTVSVSFILLPSGEIKAISLVHSSGTHSLDEAALDAIAAISPFKLAKEYLIKQKTFTIDIVFEI